MKLSKKQQIFSKNVACLIQFAESIGIGVTFGEAWRPEAQILLNYYGYTIEVHDDRPVLVPARKTSKTLESLHGKRLAVDFNFFVNGELTYNWGVIKPLGEYWVSLHPKNRWGGDWNKNDKPDGFMDVPHFEMML